MKTAVSLRPVKWTDKRRRTTLGASLAGLVACVSLAGCVGRTGPSKVASGQVYEPGEPTYDAFFKSLYGVQLLMGKAPDREKAFKQELTKIAEVPETASADELSSGVEKRLDGLAKKGIAAKVSTTGLDGTDPAARVIAVGTAADDETVKALDQAVKDGITLLSDLRHAKPELARLKEQQPTLEPKVDEAFAADSTRQKKAEVRDNLADADKLIPLMMSRGDEVDARVVELFHALEKASPAAVAAPPSTLGDTAVKKEKKPAPKKAAAPKAPAEPKAKPKPADTAPAEPKAKPAKPKASEDFEP